MSDSAPRGRPDAGVARRRVRLLVSGRVQGVFYRATTAERGRELGLAGFAKNLADGTVEVIAEGSPGAVEALIAFCREGPPLARVEAVLVAELEPTGEGGAFGVR
jgi:acylphosphatase